MPWTHLIAWASNFHAASRGGNSIKGAEALGLGTQGKARQREVGNMILMSCELGPPLGLVLLRDGHSPNGLVFMYLAFPMDR